uniref:Uncharacterized protein n=1 Tax=Oryza barthii TaxID=65489 RepID=A0A0D3F2G5_9ORYZ
MGRPSCPSAPTPPRRAVVVAGEAVDDEEELGSDGGEVGVGGCRRRKRWAAATVGEELGRRGDVSGLYFDRLRGSTITISSSPVSFVLERSSVVSNESQRFAPLSRPRYRIFCLKRRIFGIDSKSMVLVLLK